MHKEKHTALVVVCFSYINIKSAILCPNKTEMADFI